MTRRPAAVREGRAFVGVRDARTGRFSAVGVCPSCWNQRSRRPVLLAELAARGLAVVHGEDSATGTYREGAVHALRCPWGRAEGKKDES
ncbi:MAG: hypothetical protein ABSG63_14335 [Spirochaetia bacterium]